MNEPPMIDWTYLETDNECCFPDVIDGIVVHESFLKGKHYAGSNVDGIFVSPHFVAVIDGATAKSDFLLEGKTTGRLAMELIKEALAGLPAGVTMPEAIQSVTRHIRDFYVANGLLHTVEKIPERRLTACAVIYSRARHEVWQVGDCLCRVGEKCFVNSKLIDDVMAEARAAFNEVALLGDETPESIMQRDPGRAFIMPFLKLQARFQNNPEAPSAYSFAAFDGFPVLLSQINVIPVEDGREVVLASDGYPRLCATLKESESHLLHILANDPNCMRLYKSTKGVRPGNVSFDDRAYIRFTGCER